MHDDESNSDLDLDRVLTIGDVARRIGWSLARTRRMLVAAHIASGKTLLVDVGRGLVRPRFTVTLRRLRSIAGPWFPRRPARRHPARGAR